MRKLTILLLLLVVVSFADVLFAQIPDDNSHSAAGLNCYIAEDFTLTNRGRIESIEWWGWYYSTIDGTFDLHLHEDQGGFPGTILWELLDATATLTLYGGIDFYLHEIILDESDYYILEEGTTYWLSLHHNSDYTFLWSGWSNGFAAASSNGDSGWVRHYYDHMFRLSGTDNYSAIEEATWGQLKAAHGLAD